MMIASELRVGTLDNGLHICVPLFTAPGEVVRVEVKTSAIANG